MCGRYALGIRASFIRHQLQDEGMPVEDAPEDEEVRQTYNFAPGNHGLVYRANVPDYGAGPRHDNREDGQEASGEQTHPSKNMDNVTYKLQAMKWGIQATAESSELYRHGFPTDRSLLGLVPFWTKRNPDYGTVMKTINARDDSLAENRGMWNTMKQKKRCVVVAQGFYEWLKKNGGKDKIPHYTKRKDGQLMCFAGLWDCVQYEGSEEKLYTYTIITTDSNKELKFLHDRMPVVLENGSEQIRTWLDPQRYEWSKELQQMLKPFDGDLECYQVSKEVGKVGNNSPDFIVPITSSENKNNIANFFANTKSPTDKEKRNTEGKNFPVKARELLESDNRLTVNIPRTEDNAPMPLPVPDVEPSGVKREREDNYDGKKGVQLVYIDEPSRKKPKVESSSITLKESSLKTSDKGESSRKTRSATSNASTYKSSPSRASDGSQRITNFFNK